MNKINAHKDGNGNIIISEESFEILLSCLDNQKFINESPQNGDSLSVGKDNYYKNQYELQKHIDEINVECRNILHAKIEVFFDNWFLCKRYKNSNINLKWNTSDINSIRRLITRTIESGYGNLGDTKLLLYDHEGHSVIFDREIELINKALNNE